MVCLLDRLLVEEGLGKIKSQTRNAVVIRHQFVYILSTFSSLKNTLPSHFDIIHVAYFRITAPLPPQWELECDAQRASLVACAGCC